MSNRDVADELAQQEYISLETFKRNGAGVKTPVWCAPLDDEIVIFTEAKAFKVKRLGRNDHVCVAPCDVRGGVRGDWKDGSGRIVSDPDEEARAYGAFVTKYGWKMRLLNFFSTIAGRINGRAVLAIRLS
jgi:hypothetical protein